MQNDSDLYLPLRFWYKEKVAYDALNSKTKAVINVRRSKCQGFSPASTKGCLEVDGSNVQNNPLFFEDRSDILVCICKLPTRQVSGLPYFFAAFHVVFLLIDVVVL